MAINGVGSVNGVQTEQIKKNVETGVKQAKDAVNKKDNKQKLALALGALGAVGAAAVGIAMKVKKGKGVDVADMAKDGADKLKKAATDAVEEAKDGAKKISDIKFEKGIAKQGDNLFTGVIDDTLKSGKKVTLEYTDGKIQKSTIDNISKNYSYGEGLKKVNGKYFFYDQNGKIEKISERMGDGSVLRHKEFKNGELISQTNAYANGELIDGVIYAPNSKGKKIIKSIDKESLTKREGITEYFADGSTKTKIGHIADSNKSPLDELDVKNPREIVWKDKEGKVLKSLSIDKHDKTLRLDLYKGDNSIGISTKPGTNAPNKIMTSFSSEENGYVRFEDDVINRTHDLADTGALKKDITELIEILKAEGIEFSDKIQILLEKL